MSADKQTAERIQESKNRLAFSDYIAVSESTWYDFAPVMKSVLLMISFMQVYDGKKAVKSLHRDHPWKNDIEGWCFASQAYLGARTGTSEEVVRKYVARFEDDHVIEKRTWIDKMGYPHCEYRINREVVDSKHWPADLRTFLETRTPARRGGNKSGNKGSFQKGDGRPRGKASGIVSQHHRNNEPSATGIVSHNPPESSASDQRNLQPEGNGCEFRQGQSGSGQSVLGSEDLGRTITASGIASGSLRSPREEVLGRSATFKSKPARPWNLEPIKYKTSLRNKDTYPDLFDGWRPGMLVPKCKRCQALLHPSEPAHVCEGYVPKLAYEDMEDHMKVMESQRETKREIRLQRGRDLAESSGPEDAPTKACVECGDELTYEEAMEHECNIAEDDFMAEAAE
jgi:hypothetical protein